MINKCFLCESNQFHLIHHGTRNIPSIDVLKCDNCGLVRLSECVDEKYYIESGMRTNDIEQNIKEIRVAAAKDDLRRYDFIKSLIENRSYLDFGCGAGGVLLQARKVAKNIYGIELEKTMCETLNKEGICCFENLNKAIENINNQAEVISLFHVLEHLPDPVGVLNDLKKIMTPDGIMIIEVPNADDALLSLYNCKSFEDFTYWESHIYLYNNFTLKKLVEKAGFKLRFLSQIQRYPLANTLYWLSNGKPGGHREWNMMCNSSLDDEYGNQLAKMGIADTIIAIIEKV